MGLPNPVSAAWDWFTQEPAPGEATVADIATGDDPKSKQDRAAKAAQQQASQQQAATQGAQVAGQQGSADSTAGNTAGFNPLAVQLFFSQAIAPMLQGLVGKLGDQNKQFADMAQANLDHFQMPDSYKAIFGQSIPRQAAAQADVVSALAGAAASGPALDQLMGQVNEARNASVKDYINQQLYGGAGGANSFLGQLLSGGAGTTPTGG